MSFRLELRPQVLDDVAVASAWYDQRELGLGARFATAVEHRLSELLRIHYLPESGIAPGRFDGFIRAHFPIESFIVCG